MSTGIEPGPLQVLRMLLSNIRRLSQLLFWRPVSMCLYSICAHVKLKEGGDNRLRENDLCTIIAADMIAHHDNAWLAPQLTL
jgi:hypothetical protein